MLGQVWLNELPARLDAALAQAAVLVAGRARELAPSKSGQLRDSIEAQENTIIVTAPYAAAVESKQPFLRPALLEMREDIAKFIEEHSLSRGAGEG